MLGAHQGAWCPSPDARRHESLQAGSMRFPVTIQGGLTGQRLAHVNSATRNTPRDSRTAITAARVALQHFPQPAQMDRGRGVNKHHRHSAMRSLIRTLHAGSRSGHAPVDRFLGGESPSIIFMCGSKVAHVEAVNSPAVLLQVGREMRSELRGPVRAWPGRPNDGAMEGYDVGQHEHMGSRCANP